MSQKTVVSLIWGNNPGGVTEYVKNIGEISDTTEFHIKTVILQKKKWGNDFSAFNNTDFEVIYFNHIFLFIWLKKLIELIYRESPSFLFAHAFNGAIIGGIVKVVSKIKFTLVCTYHGLYFAPKVSRKILAPIYNTLIIYIYKYVATGVICVSEFSKNELISKGVNKNKTRVIYNGIPLYPSFSKSHIYKKKKNELLLGVICRLVPLKGVHILIEAIRDIPNVKLLIIGDGPIKKELMNQAKGIISKVEFVGNQNNVSDWLNIIDIFVLPTLAENHSISILEAMRQGKAIITTDVGGNSESIRNGKEGILVPVRDAKALQKALLYLRNNPNKINELGDNAKKSFKTRFTDIIMKKTTMNFFENFIED